MNRVPFTPRGSAGGRINRAGASRAAFLPLKIEVHDNLARGPGWYESSRDLIRGLDVHEDPADDPGIGDWPTQFLCADHPRASGQGSPYTRRPENPPA